MGTLPVIVDGFAGGCRGWSEGLRMLGLTDTDIGIEWDEAACATATAAGHLTIRADVAAYPTGPFVGKTEGIVMSAPCQAFSQAGKGDGIRALAVLAAAARDVAVAADVPRLDLDDARAELVLEPVRWVRDLRPRWVALEQTPLVLPLWDLYAHLFGQWGYRCWTGVLCAADYGVPQTRRRAILLASLDRQPTCPPATHCERGEPAALFGDNRLPWVSMLDALPWLADLAEWDGPARTLCGARSPRWMWELRAGAQENAAVRSIDEPAPTVLASWDNGDTRLVLRGNQERAAGGYYEREVDRPAQTITGQAVRFSWIRTRPATTVCCDPRLWPPGHKINSGDRARLGVNEADERYGNRVGADSIRLDIRDGLILQGFPPDHPVQGTKSEQWTQVGNAIPPLLAAHCIAAASGWPLGALISEAIG